MADANQLELALLNVALNAHDAMPGGGRIQICAVAQTVGGRGGLKAWLQGAKPQDAAAPNLPAGEYVRITIADTGEGMDAATLAKAAEPFFTTKGPGKGTGLGLSMVQGLAAQSGGLLRIQSEPGTGTVVELWLPKAKTAPTPAPDAQSPIAATAQSDRRHATAAFRN